MDFFELEILTSTTLSEYLMYKKASLRLLSGEASASGTGIEPAYSRQARTGLPPQDYKSTMTLKISYLGRF